MLFEFTSISILKQICVVIRILGVIYPPIIPEWWQSATLVSIFRSSRHILINFREGFWWKMLSLQCNGEIIFMLNCKNRLNNGNIYGTTVSVNRFCCFCCYLTKNNRKDLTFLLKTYISTFVDVIKFSKYFGFICG